MTAFEKVFNVDKRIFFIFLCLYYFLNTFLVKDILVTKELYYQTYGEQVALEQIDTYIETTKKWNWISYAMIPVILAIKISFVALCINIGALLSNIKTSFKQLFGVVLVSHVIFALASFTKGLWLLFFTDISTLHDIQKFYPLSFLNLFDIDSLKAWMIYPLQTLNLFELGYWLLIAAGLKYILEKPYKNMLGLVIGSYGLGLLVWIVVVMFLSINFS